MTTDLRSRIQQPKTFNPTFINFEFDPIFYNSVQLERIDSPNGRVYISPSGKKMVSVTTLLSKTASKESVKAIENWRKREGEEEADRITKKAAERGAALHELCEYYITQDKRFQLPPEGSNVHSLFKQIYPCFKNIGKVYGIESSLYSEKFGIAGTADCIAEYNGKLSIVDFKSTRKEKYEQYITDYFIQETAYCIMFSEMYGIPVKQIVTLMARDNAPLSDAQVFIKNPIDYVEPLLKKIKAYHAA